jgi:hypothetical protein
LRRLFVPSRWDPRPNLTAAPSATAANILSHLFGDPPDEEDDRKGRQRDDIHEGFLAPACCLICWRRLELVGLTVEAEKLSV